MPRVTRAALRSQPSPNVSEPAAAVSLPATSPISRRTPLGEISGNQEDLPAAVDNPERILKANKGIGKGKKGKGSKKSQIQDGAITKDKSADVLPDENESDTSSAVEDACQDLRKEQPEDTNQVVMHATGPQSPPSPAVTAATELLASTTTPEDTAMTAHGDQANIDQNTEEFPQAVSVPLEQDMDRSKESTQISSQLGIKDGDTSEQEGDPSSRKENKSPVKAVLRLEDSIEAIDKFEEEIERVGDLIPAISNSAQSPKDLEKQEKPVTVARKETSTQNSSTPKTRKDSKPCNPKAAALVKKKAAVHPRALATLPASKVDPKARQVSDSSTTSDKPPVAARKRVSAIHKAPFVPAKSTKPPTRSNFELPGEAVARKLREAREERMKREEEEKAKKPAFKARPVRISQGPVVKATATSRVRISMAKGEIPAVAAAKDVTTKPKVAPRPSDVSALGKRLSTVSVNKRSAPAPAHTSARVMRGPPSGTVRQSVNATDAAQLRAKGKEVFNRGKVEQDEREKMKKEKEDAAKKARAEAAERGRIASREWAEKQKAKKMAEKQAKGETPTIGEASLPAA